MNLQIYVSHSYNPCFNLALEDLLFQTIPEDTVLLYLWQNQNTVVIGKSQNAWKECRVSLLEEDGGIVVRRTSGGGAVFHDLGNMCYTFLASSGHYDLPKQLSVILKAVSDLGIPAHFTGRNDICTEDGRKFSGNAFRFVKDKGLMHGTLLLDTDSDKMARYLQVSKAKIEAKGISSVRSRVVNLTELNPEITPERMKAALIDAFQTIYGAGQVLQPIDVSPEGDSISPALPGSALFPSLLQKFSSWDWRLGDIPAFGIQAEQKFSWGLVQLSLHTQDGRIDQAQVYTDAMDAELGEVLSQCLQEQMLNLPTLHQAITSSCLQMHAAHLMFTDPEVISRDLCELLRDIL